MIDPVAPDPLALAPVTTLAALPPDVDAVILPDGPATVVAAQPSEVIMASGPEALAHLDTLSSGWWAGWLSYDLGRSVERVLPRTPDDLGLPDLLLMRFDARAIFAPAPAPPRIEGKGPAARLLRHAIADAPSVTLPPPPHLGHPVSSLGRNDFEAGVRAVVELIRAGDCYQVNLTRRLAWDEAADPIALHAALVRANPAPHAGMVRAGDTSVVSASPEQFLRREGPMVVTRPIKGTGHDPRQLLASAKDRAENVMIVDLARNDLGRVCEYGSIEVDALCRPEEHPGLHHLVSTVRGELRPDVTTGDLVRATFAPASVTGAPKPRVMQAIEDLEPVRRGIYCGAVGWIDPENARLDVNVAIRTFTLHAGRTFLGVGGGIVADSEPAAEWEETELKISRLLAATGAGDLVGSPR